MRRQEIVEAHGGRGSEDEMDMDIMEESDDSQDENSMAHMGRKGLLGLPRNKKQEVKQVKNRQRVLILSSRGIIHRFRHLLNDLHVLMPHSKKENKLDTKQNLHVINELAELTNCNNAIFFEVRKHQDLYMWLSKTPNGPSIKFHVQNIHTMDELNMTGNCLKGSRPILSFDSTFDHALKNPDSDFAHLPLVKELLTHAFATPKTSRKIKPFIDHVISFSWCDGRIWFRTWQIVEKSESKKGEEDVSLVEIGPRFVLNIIRIFDGAFGGRTLFENPDFVSPNAVRRDLKVEKSAKYIQRTEDAKNLVRKKKNAATLPVEAADLVFHE